MFPVVEANFLAITPPGFWSYSGHKKQRRLCRILGRAALVVTGGMQLRHYDTNNGGGGERRRRKS